MTVRQSIQEIESRQFSSRLNLASDLTTFLSAAGDEEAVSSLAGQLQYQETVVQIFREVLELSRRSVDARYRHPWDTALAIYLWLLSRGEPAIAALAAEVVAQTAQCWWASRFASSILLTRHARSSAKTQEQSVVLRGPAMSISQQDAVPDTFFLDGFVRERSRFATLALLSPPEARTRAA